jgi:hypothetical protein
MPVINSNRPGGNFSREYSGSNWRSISAEETISSGKV